MGGFALERRSISTTVLRRLPVGRIGAGILHCEGFKVAKLVGGGEEEEMEVKANVVCEMR